MSKFNVVIKELFMNCEYIYPIQQRKVKEFIEYFKTNKNVKRIIIFGSSITRACHIGSDVDIYVQLKKKEKIINKYFDFLYDLWTNFTVDEKLENEIIKNGIVVYERE